jgi:hypothetical protein
MKGDTMDIIALILSFVVLEILGFPPPEHPGAIPDPSNRPSFTVPVFCI